MFIVKVLEDVEPPLYHPDEAELCLCVSPSDSGALCRPLLQTLQEELCGRQRQVSSLQEISSQLLLEATGEDSIEAKEKVHVICNKLRLLLRQTAADLSALQGRLVRPQTLRCFLTADDPVKKAHVETGRRVQ